MNQLTSSYIQKIFVNQVTVHNLAQGKTRRLTFINHIQRKLRDYEKIYFLREQKGRRKTQVMLRYQREEMQEEIYSYISN